MLLIKLTDNKDISKLTQIFVDSQTNSYFRQDISFYNKILVNMHWKNNFRLRKHINYQKVLIILNSWIVRMERCLLKTRTNFEIWYL